MPNFLVQVDFHHNAAFAVVLVAADDRDAAESRAFEYFEEDEDLALEFVAVIREAGPEDEGKFRRI